MAVSGVLKTTARFEEHPPKLGFFAREEGDRLLARQSAGSAPVFMGKVFILCEPQLPYL